MNEAVILSTARTGLAKSWKGAFNMTHGATMGGHVLKASIERAKIDAGEIEDVIMGCSTPEGATGGNIARQIALRAGCPVTTAGMTINRFCASGLQSIATAAQRIIAGEGEIYAAGGVESISCVQNEMNTHMLTETWLKSNKPEIYWPMIQTAEMVAKRYNIAKERQDAYGVLSQQRAAAAQAAGRFNDEIIPMTTIMGITDKETGTRLTKEVTISSDEGIRPDTTLEGVSNIRTVIPGGVITAGNASQFSDGASVAIVMNSKVAETRGLQPLGIFRGFAVCRYSRNSDGSFECEWWCNRRRPSVRCIRCAPHRSCVNRRQAPRCQVCSGYHVYWRRTRGRGALRSLLKSLVRSTLPPRAVFPVGYEIIEGQLYAYRSTSSPANRFAAAGGL